ncbi:hypothetical protein [Agaribacterium sp. ZY112]|uniref:hypothetical protein n=1 Tax=Agaribacterium sp. ZY112 TaxID=3233574 RepID=UPI00352671A6
MHTLQRAMAKDQNLPKAKPSIAMQTLLDQARAQLPLDKSSASLCRGPCKGCPKKLLEFANQEIEDWQAMLDAAEEPKLGDISALAKRLSKIKKALLANGF